MKFHFLNGLDCPDWLFAEIAEFSKLSALKFKIFCAVCANAVLEAREQLTEADSSKLKLDQFDEKALRRMFFASCFIFSKAAKAECPESDLENELQQLGLPIEHSKQMARIYCTNQKQMWDILSTDIRKKPAFSIKSVIKEPEQVVVDVAEDTGAAVRLLLPPPLFTHLLNDLNDAHSLVQRLAE